MDSPTETKEASSTVKKDLEFGKVSTQEQSENVPEGCQASKMMKSLSPSKRRDLEFSAQQMDGLDLSVRGLSGNLPVVKSSEVTLDVKDQTTDLSKGEMRISSRDAMTCVKKDSIKSPESKAIKDWRLVPISPYTAKSNTLELKQEKSKLQFEPNKSKPHYRVLSALNDVKSLSTLIEVVNISFASGESALISRVINGEALDSYYRGYRVFFGTAFRQYKEIREEMLTHLNDIDMRMKVGMNLVVQPGRDVYGIPNPQRDGLVAFNEKLRTQLNKSRKHLEDAVNLLNDKIHPKLNNLVGLNLEMKKLTEDFLDVEFPHLFIGGHVSENAFL